MDDTWYKIPWRVFCIGKLGTEFYNRYKDKLGIKHAVCVSDYHYEDFEPYDYDLELYSKEHWMLIAEFEQEIWDKYLENAKIKKLLQ